MEDVVTEPHHTVMDNGKTLVTQSGVSSLCSYDGTLSHRPWSKARRRKIQSFFILFVSFWISNYTEGTTNILLSIWQLQDHQKEILIV